MYRQGDALIVPVSQEALPAKVDTLPRQVRDGLGRLVLTPGEVTGHAHAVVGPGRLVSEPGAFGSSYLHLPEGGRAVHEERAAIPLPKGWYRVVRQREYTPDAVRVVAD
jgi:hypothetical protein